MFQESILLAHMANLEGITVSVSGWFIYVPIINEDKKCLKMDKTLGNTAVVLRLLRDLIYIGDIVLNFAEACKALKEKWSWKRGKLLGNALEIWKDSWLVLLVDFLAILPIPQTVVLIFIPKVKGSRSLNKGKFLNFLLLSQYVTRVFRIYLSAKELAWSWDTLITGTAWIRALSTFSFSFLPVMYLEHFGIFSLFNVKQHAGTKLVQETLALVVVVTVLLVVIKIQIQL
ncbi:hypothetical protein FNV43_RR08714 [Rhamnella rubrinervis]|uniref:Uncharacterized protein n=1 Tax=Rhamnella rubrinervis TaxID=2594499 RepID=A0A8K0H8Q0_9ROSA|nr:hypothetical protein FNV43_RR08714 [Rhamnella rubrinervis]